VTVTVVDNLERSVSGVTVMVMVTFLFNGRLCTYSYDTDANGICDVQITGLRNYIDELIFNVDNVDGSLLFSNNDNDDDPDGASDGTSLILSHP
jgi:hypothetical protein